MRERTTTVRGVPVRYVSACTRISYPSCMPSFSALVRPSGKLRKSIGYMCPVRVAELLYSLGNLDPLTPGPLSRELGAEGLRD